MTTTTRTAPATTEKAPKTTHDCRCGCGTSVRGTFAPGHDARHCSNLRRAYEAGEITRARALAQVKDSSMLTAKLTRSLDLADQRKAAAREQAKAKAPAPRPGASNRQAVEGRKTQDATDQAAKDAA